MGRCVRGGPGRPGSAGLLGVFLGLLLLLVPGQAEEQTQDGLQIPIPDIWGSTEGSQVLQRAITLPKNLRETFRHSEDQSWRSALSQFRELNPVNTS